MLQRWKTYLKILKNQLLKFNNVAKNNLNTNFAKNNLNTNFYEIKSN